MLFSYNPVTEEWQPLARMQVARCQMGVAILDRYLYVVGGNSSSQAVLSSVERYSFDDNTWTTVCAMSVPRAIPAVAAADGLLYVAGGDQVITSQMVCYSQHEYSGLMLCFFCKKPCEATFYRAQVTISAVECYDPLTDTWKNCPDLPVSRSEAGAVVV